MSKGQLVSFRCFVSFLYENLNKQKQPGVTLRRAERQYINKEGISYLLGIECRQCKWRVCFMNGGQIHFARVPGPTRVFTALAG